MIIILSKRTRWKRYKAFEHYLSQEIKFYTISSCKHISCYLVLSDKEPEIIRNSVIYQKNLIGYDDFIFSFEITGLCSFLTFQDLRSELMDTFGNFLNEKEYANIDEEFIKDFKERLEQQGL